MPADPNKQKRKAYYRKCAAQSKRPHLNGKPGSNASGAPKNLQPGMVGYLVTCNLHERLATMEMFRLLNDALKRVSSAAQKFDEDVVCKDTASNGGVVAGGCGNSPKRSHP
ncbi:hypothetical protein FGIG_10197 [Fasciola gigantica]|uniref:Uncharacterized protein n=1 Tax=Fasciola gigantica TaxID=46835 RepID=A0A504YX29_FASGI|nr:hypothetical protein FGIG_10197 [Fasciola gigantica]